MNMEQRVAAAKDLSTNFAKHYYDTFDTNRANLASLYCDVSIMQFESATHIGKENIMKSLVELPFKVVKHLVTTVDGQPTIDEGVIIHVLGQLKADEDPPHSFSQTFYVKMLKENYFILNEVFRLSIHHQM